MEGQEGGHVHEISNQPLLKGESIQTNNIDSLKLLPLPPLSTLGLKFKSVIKWWGKPESYIATQFLI